MGALELVSRCRRQTGGGGGGNRIMKERMSTRRSENTKLLPGYSLPLQ